MPLHVFNAAEPLKGVITFNCSAGFNPLPTFILQMSKITFNQYPQFFTATILEWKHLLANDIFKHIIISSLQFLVKDGRVVLYGFVLMPNHIHLIWQIQDTHERASVQQSFLKYTAQQIKFEIDRKSVV